MKDRPVLFDLAHLLDAGVAPLNALERLLTNQSNGSETLTQLRNDLRRGFSLAKSLNNAGLASRLETEIVKAAEDAGKVQEALLYVATNFERRSERVARLRVRLWMPNTVLFVALAVGVVRAVTAGSSPVSAVASAVFVAVIVVSASKLILAYVSRDGSHWLGIGWRLGLQRGSDLFRQLFEQTFYTLFVWLAEAGVEQLAAAKTLASVVDAPAYNSALKQYRQSVAAGVSVAESLAHADLTVPGELAQVIASSEQAGRLAPALRHYLDLQAERLERTVDAIYTWLPRFYYVALLVIGAAFVF